MGKKIKLHQTYPSKRNPKEQFPGATTPITTQLGWNKPQMMAWSRKEAMNGNDPNKIRDQAADIGTIAHYLIECHLKKIKPDLAEYAPSDIDKAENAFIGYLEWEENQDLYPLAVEWRGVNEDYKYGGTIDLICVLNDHLTLIDFKTSKAIYEEHKVQLAAYAYLDFTDLLAKYHNKFSANTMRYYILHLDKGDGSFTPHMLKNIELYWQVFIHCIQLYYLQRQIREGK